MKEADKKRKLTPSVKSLAIKFGTKDVRSLNDGIVFIRDNLAAGMKLGFQAAFDAIDAVKASHDNPYGDDDEAIAKAILDETEKHVARGRRGS